MNLFDYLLRANLYLLLFFGCYYLLLRRHTFFTLNRVYLLASVGLALGLPFVELPDDTVADLPPIRTQLLQSVTISPDELASTGPDWVTIGWWVYGLVAAGLFLRLIWRTTRLLAFIGQNPHNHLPDYTLVQPTDPQTPTFSFFRYLVLSPADTDSELISQHEQVHIRQWHSIDVLFFEVVQALFWYNPILLAYQVAIREVHEFLADRAASSQQRSAYANYLVSYALGGHADPLTNSFFRPSLLLSRLRMLQQHATTCWALGKYALVVPVMLAALALTAARPEVERLVSPLLSLKPFVVKGRVVNKENKPLPGAIIELKNTQSGTTTDMNGKFQLNIPQPNSQLIVSFVGHKTQEVVAKEGTDLLITLQNNSNRSDKTSIQQPRPQKTSNTSKSAQNTTAPRLSENRVKNASSTFPRPGVKNALPTEPLSSLSDRSEAERAFQFDKVKAQADPLYVIDGLIRGKESFDAIRSGDIESVNVIKGPSAQAIYGQEGVSGVVLIKTKKVKKDEPEPAKK